MTRLAVTCWICLLAMLVASAPSALAAELQVKAVTSKFPIKGLKPVGSGSGVIIGPRHVLTNRHVAAREDGTPFDGFRIRLGPDFRAGTTARTCWICQDYDLALLETSAKLPSQSIQVLDGLAALGSKVSTYGFPSGDAFGISLTAGGGQIARHPVTGKNTRGDSETVEVRNALWHDAIISAGSSGGPLMNEAGVLVGLNFGELIRAKHAIAVPSPAIVEFLRKTGLVEQVQVVNTTSGPGEIASQVSAKDVTAYVEILGKSDSVPELGPAPASDGQPFAGSQPVDQLRGMLLKRLEQVAPKLTDSQLANVRENLRLAFEPSSPTRLESNKIVRLQTKATIVQILDDGMVTEMGSVITLLRPLGYDARSVRARVGRNVSLEMDLDDVYYVDRPVDYKTVAGGKKSVHTLIPVNSLLDERSLQGLVSVEKTRRSEARQKEQATALSEMRERLTRSFSDVSGKRTIEATIVRVNGPAKTVDLLRSGSNEKLTIPLEKLSADDRQWINSKVKLIKEFGPQIAAQVAPSK